MNVVSNLLKKMVVELSQGFLLFGGPVDIVIMLLDVFVTTCLFYFILKLLSETRAWQLLKGVVFLIICGQIFSLLGLQAISFLLNSALSFLAITLLVLFQPELRKALETLGRNTLSFVQTLPFDNKEGNVETYAAISAIKLACAEMSADYTGALILIERQTKLGEIIEKGQAVVLNAKLSTTMLKQIFYKGSPLHDGACVIRDNYIYAARCHVPLSGSTRLNKDYGTRHRAAISASEISDAIAIVCSEEQGSISVAVDGNLIKVKNAQVLADVLQRFLVPNTVEKQEKKTFWQELKTFFNKQFELNADVLDDFVQSAPTNEKAIKSSSAVVSAKTESNKLLKEAGTKLGESGSKSADIGIKEKEAALAVAENSANLNTNRERISKHKINLHKKWGRTRTGIQLTALVLAVFVWFYVQATTNVVSSRRFNVTITVSNQAEIDKYNLDYHLGSWKTDVVVQARERNLRTINNADIQAQLDFAQLDEESKKKLQQLSNKNKTPVKLTLPLKIWVNDKPYYSYRIVSGNPSNIEIMFWPILQKNAAGTNEAVQAPKKSENSLAK